MATNPEKMDKSISVINKELEKLRDIPLGKVQMHRAKEQLMGQLAMAEENNTSLMLMMGRSMLDLDKIDSLESIFEEIKNIKSSHLQELANEIFESNRLSILKFVPIA